VSLIDPKNQEPSKARDDQGQFAEGNAYAFRPGVSGNPKGRPPKTEILKALDANWGAFPREALYQIMIATMTGETLKSENGEPIEIIGQMKAETFAKIMIYLDEQANGKAKQSVGVEGLKIVLPDFANDL